MKLPIPRTIAVAIICGVVAGAAGVMLLSQSSSLLVHPGGPHEDLCMGFTRINSPTNMSLNVVNGGNYPAVPISYYVKDSAGNMYANPNWSVPTIPLIANVALRILVDGNTFTFQHGTSYTINLNTQRVHYTFTVLT